MASSIPLLDDDDGFDWEAAVREIDVACQSTATAAPPFQTPPPPQPPQLPFLAGNHVLKKPQINNNSRQLTLDKFMSTGVSGPKEKQSNEGENGGEGGDNDEQARVCERVSYVDIDPEAAKSWIYPDNVPRREYQLAISKTALFSNTLVALPTGLGKTLIAAVVMYNYFRWFPEGKIVFAAPSRPLVMQQIEACHNIVGIPQEWTIDMTGLTSPPKRALLWRSKRVFFVTPQVLEKDIQSGACLVKYLVCLVIDEAHRAMGNYSYCVAVRELMAVPVELRILALTATPGSKQETIQLVIDNLQISTLEYRNESDVDVCPYVHNRKIELIEVPMGKDASEINNLLLEAIRPIAVRLSAMGVLPNRDFQTLSPCDLLNSRDKFRQAPPPEVSSVKYGEVEGYFGVLITLYHIRKLLSGHGIRPTHEMLEEKLRQGYFARLMSRNEAIQKAKTLMQKSVSHGAPSPKLSKMLEVLVDHFSNNDPQNSRVIIFSNFRGSVRDILDSLAKVGHSIKATQFIGQSSGKNLKGQSQKIQQAVLEKFRTGGFNVIVATSIGEEGLDIMEVDLVICFDANISPLRMIQRMGRTGRKHDGRVVVLACEGTELKGYRRKQATGKTVRKHMQHGGMNSFNFYPSPRMVAHLFKPELEFVELSIEKFVRQTNKGKNDSPKAAKFREKLSDAEAALLNKYFQPIEESCKPSLIAFPHFQAFPSRVHTVKHSSRTGWLIDAMQHLQGLSPSTMDKEFPVDLPRSPCFSAGSIEQHNEGGRGKGKFNSEVPSSGNSTDKKKQTLDVTDRVSDTVAPLPAISPSNKHNVPYSSTQIGCKGHSVKKPLYLFDSEFSETAAGDVLIVHTPPFDEKQEENVDCEIVDAMEFNSPAIPARKCDLDAADDDFSPRLTNYINNGFVPESPLSTSAEDFSLNKNDGDVVDQVVGEGKYEFLVPEPTSPPKSCANGLMFADEEFTVAAQTKDITSSPVVDKMNTPSHRPPDAPSNMRGSSESPIMQNFRTPLRNLTNSSGSEDWRISSGEKSGGGEHSFRPKRLRKIGDLAKQRLLLSAKRSTCSFADLALKSTDVPPKKLSRVKKSFEDARDFIDEEAEVSSADVVPDSEDEGNYEDSEAYEDSFIDDQADAIVDSSQAEDNKVDMMAVYRRSLLTQSPFQEKHIHPAILSPQSVPSTTVMTESGECSGKPYSLQTSQGCSKSSSICAGKVCSRLNPMAREATKGNNSSLLVNEAIMDSRKRKMNSVRGFTLPAKNLEKEFCSRSELPGKELPLSYQSNGIEANYIAFPDDQFYESLDLDALEAQAVKLLSQRAGSSAHGKIISEPAPTHLSSPSFDLGIL